MRKPSLLISTSLLSLLGLLFFVFPAWAVTKSQLSAAVKIVCPDNYGNWFSGTGTIIDSKGVILTNKHVVTDEHGGTLRACFIGFTSSPEEEPNFGTEVSRNVAETKYFTNEKGLDAAILYIKNTDNRVFPSINIWNSNSASLQFGEKIEVVGFPGIGGNTITYSSGDFSGFGSSSDGTKNYLKTTAAIEHGNSGGAAYNSKGEFVGIPSMVIAGTLNSLGYLLSVNSIKQWLLGILGQNYSQTIPQQPVVVEKPQRALQSDTSPPFLKWFDIDYQVINDDASKQSRIRYTIPLTKIVEDSAVKRIFYYFGSSPIADPAVDGKKLVVQEGLTKVVIPEQFLLTDQTKQYFIIKLQDTVGNISDAIVAPPAPMQLGRLNQIYQKEKSIYRITNQQIKQKYSGLFLKQGGAIWWLSPKDGVRYLVYDQKMSLRDFAERMSGLFNGEWNGFNANTGIFYSDYIKKPRTVWGQFLTVFKDGAAGQSTDVGCALGCYIDPRNGQEYNFSSIQEGGDNWINADANLFHAIDALTVQISRQELSAIEPLGSNNYVWYGLQWYVSHNQMPFYGFSIYDPGLAANVRGKILLDVESHGEAWYVNPDDGKRYYMKDGSAAFGLMRTFALGISDKDLTKIPANDDLKVGDKKLIERMSGKILLQVEHAGDAWYVNPANGKRYFMGKPGDAYNLMRTLGLGITTSDLEKIPIGILD